VRRIAENKCADYFREKARREKWEAAPEAAISETFYDPPLEAIPDPHPSPEAAYLQQELYAAVERGIEQLTPRQHDILRLRFYHDLTYAQIAEVLNLPMGVVISQYRAAVRRLRKNLGKFL
jgi:RNA polymerase sigma factor (sigma-70 family)